MISIKPWKDTPTAEIMAYLIDYMEKPYNRKSAFDAVEVLQERIPDWDFSPVEDFVKGKAGLPAAQVCLFKLFDWLGENYDPSPPKP